MDLDHTMPLSAFWSLDESATCLCQRCNSLKSDKFPIEFYNEEELNELSKITGLDYKFIRSKIPNVKVIKELLKKIVWFFDDFLNNKDYQKVRNDKKTADLIFNAIDKQIKRIYPKIDLVEFYKKVTGKNPSSITL